MMGAPLRFNILTIRASSHPTELGQDLVLLGSQSIAASSTTQTNVCPWRESAQLKPCQQLAAVVLRYLSMATAAHAHLLLCSV
jgi:hypothetical protein